MMVGAFWGSDSSGMGLWAARAKRGNHHRLVAVNNSGLTTMDKANAPTSSDAESALMAFTPAAAWNTTNANSPPCASNSTSTGRSATGMPMARASSHNTTALMAQNAATKAAIRPGAAHNTPKSMPMPTAMKNRPSNRPLNGSMSVSSSCRYSLSANSTPAKKAPKAMDKPTQCIRADTATTNNSAAAVKISGVPLLAVARNKGRNTVRPPSTTPPITSTVRSTSRALSAKGTGLGSAKGAANSGKRAKMGMAATSWNSRMENPAWPPA